MATFESHWYDVSNKRKWFWTLQLIGWTAVMVVAANVLGNSAGTLMPLVLCRGLFGLVLTSFLVRPLLRRLRGLSSKAVRWWLPALLLLAYLLSTADSASIRWLARRWPGEESRSEAVLHFLNSSGPLRFVAYSGWMILYFVINDLIESNSARLRLERLKSEMVESELRLLRAQVNPHFLFNALTSIIGEARHPDRVTRLTHSLASFLRFSLSQSTALQALGDELTALEGYLQVEKIRFEDRLEYTVVADPAARQMQVPSALVQPLVENAIKFGQRTSPRPLRLAIHAQALPEGLRIEVSNTGKWVEEGSGDSTGIGLANLRRRLQLLCGDHAEVRHEVLDDRVVVRVMVPATPAPEPQPLPLPA
jgi:hypothetical protein